MPDTVKEITPAAGIRFTVASRAQRRFSNVGTFNALAGSGSLPTFSLHATGFVRKLHLFFSVNYTAASGAAVVAGDSPWNIINGVTVTDATGQPVVQPISGYMLYLKNKYFPAGGIKSNDQRGGLSITPQGGPEFAYSVSGGTTGVATFRLDIDFEQDYNTGYGCIPNLDSNAALQLKIDVASIGNLFTGTGATVGTVSVRVSQYYWAPVGATINGAPTQDTPIGFGDYVETRYETQTLSASSENLQPVTNRGGLIKGIIAVSRAAGVRTDFTAGSNVGLVLDNNPKDEGIPIEEHKDWLRRAYGYMGPDLTTSYAPLAGAFPGLDRGVLVWPFFAESGGRDSWLNTRVGSLLQLRVTPGAGATELNVLTEIAQVRDSSAFYASSSLD